ncbi:MAG TPA: hypothetical protein GXZ87_09135 [Bacteroidales bacterium]|nr:hypothetical protein [Bacteroidales bacterium]
MDRTYTIGRKAMFLFQQLEKELLEACLDDKPMQDVLDNHLNEIIAFYDELKQEAKELFQSEKSYEYPKKLLYASLKLKMFIEKILLNSEIRTNKEILNLLFDEETLEFSILVGFYEVTDYEEFPF